MAAPAREPREKRDEVPQERRHRTVYRVERDPRWDDDTWDADLVEWLRQRLAE